MPTSLKCWLMLVHSPVASDEVSSLSIFLFSLVLSYISNLMESFGALNQISYTQRSPLSLFSYLDWTWTEVNFISCSCSYCQDTKLFFLQLTDAKFNSHLWDGKCCGLDLLSLKMWLFPHRLINHLIMFFFVFKRVIVAARGKMWHSILIGWIWDVVPYD